MLEKQKIHVSRQTLILIGMVILFGIIYISLCFNYNLGVDEAYSIRTFNKDWPELIKRTAGDTHPPLYYFIARICLLLFGEDIPKYKFVPVAFGILTMSLSIFYVKPRFGFKTAVYYILFLFGIPYLTEYIIQIRMYAPVLFFVTWAAMQAYEVYLKPDKKNFAILFIAALCACYTHNYGLLAAFVIYMILGVFLWFREKKALLSWFVSGVLIALCFLPWLFILVHQMENMPEHFMAQPITLHLLLEIVTELFSSKIAGTAYMFWFLIAVCAVICIKGIRQKEEQAVVAGSMFLIFLLTFLSGIILSIVITPLLMTRYLVSCLGVLSLFLAYGIGKLPKTSGIFAGIFILAVGIQSYTTNFSMEYLLHKSNQTVEYFRENLGDNDYVVYNSEGTRWIYECYFDEDHLIFLSDFDFSGDYDNVYFLDSCCEPWISTDELAANNLEESYEGRYGIEFNDFYIYKISHKQ